MGGHHVVSTLRSRNKTSAASGGKQSRTEGERGWEWEWEGGGGREGEGERDGEKSFHDKNCPLAVR